MIPVAWYLILQLFGSNNFSLELAKAANPECGSFTELTILMRADTFSISKQNYLNRVEYGARDRSIPLQIDEDYFNCMGMEQAEMLLVSEKGVWGGYSLTRDGVDLLLTELDILLLKSKYGKGAKR